MTMLRSDQLHRALDLLGTVLDQRGQTYELVAIGGSALLLLGIHQRPTQDLDVVAVLDEGRFVRADPLPAALRAAGADVATALSISPDWLDSRPASLLDFGLPPGFAERMQAQRFGALTIHVASRLDQVYFKVYAATDHGPNSRHFADLKTLAPTREELIEAGRWTRTHDPSDGFRGDLIGLLHTLGVEDADEFV